MDDNNDQCGSGKSQNHTLMIKCKVCDILIISKNSFIVALASWGKNGIWLSGFDKHATSAKFFYVKLSSPGYNAILTTNQCLDLL